MECCLVFVFVLASSLPANGLPLLQKTFVLVDEITISSAHDALQRTTDDLDAAFGVLHDLADSLDPQNGWSRNMDITNKRNWHALDRITTSLESLIDHNDPRTMSGPNNNILTIISLINEISNSLY
ncbi:hypothetical protein COEREDRAFT_6758 [Coemansia reversa NRRL 1564]|uniref:Uncharacterized protein n=1 Tax=Coemansia reversa (strain ATCC 12441 / NRRL 1564) TaxID=763665 RepID=A0A2G5BG91_COERN|nr:hypothetical protein COEREDRAFT_6758 [Coemansia reversa NRRL 1564]|eukprot:PIA18013.1 hypothetical protein COEREDRAFT_6758 [Coemansia reversa NRRL 1564]